MATYEQYLKEAREMELSGGPHVGRVDGQINKYLEKRRREGATVEREDLKFAQSADGNGWIIYDEVPEAPPGQEARRNVEETGLPEEPTFEEKRARAQIASRQMAKESQWARELMAKQAYELKNSVKQGDPGTLEKAAEQALKEESKAALAKDYEQQLRSDDYVTGSTSTYSEAFRVCVYPTTSDKKGNPSRRVWIEVDNASLSFSRNDARALAAALVEATDVLVDPPGLSDLRITQERREIIE